MRRLWCRCALTLRAGGDACVPLEEGDAAYLPEDAAGGWENMGRRPARALVIQAAPGRAALPFPQAGWGVDQPAATWADRGW